MNKIQKPKQTQEKPLFTVLIKAMGEKIFAWDFVMENENTITFVGKTIVEKKKPVKKLYKAVELKTKAQFCIEANFSFPCTEYAYLPSQFIASANCEVRNCSKRPKEKTFAWFSNIAPLLLAIEYKDSLLATEIFHKRAHLFMQYPTTTIKLLESISVEGLFSWIWGRFDEKAMHDVQTIFEGKCTKPFSQWGVAETFFTAARRRFTITLNSFESIDDCMIHYLRTHKGTTMTLGIVGTNHYRWVEKNLYDMQQKNLCRQKLFSQTKTVLEADTANTFDKNAVALYAEESKDFAGQNKNTLGYVRKTGAELLRKALPNKLHFSSNLARLGYSQGGSTGIVVELTI